MADGFFCFKGVGGCRWLMHGSRSRFEREGECSCASLVLCSRCRIRHDFPCM